MINPTTQAGMGTVPPGLPIGTMFGAQPQPFSPFTIPPGVAGYGYAAPLPYPLGFGPQQAGFGGQQFGFGGQQLGFGGQLGFAQPQVQAQLQVLPVLTIHGWVPCLLATVGPPVATGLSGGFVAPQLGATLGGIGGLGFAPPIQAQAQFGQAPWQQQIPWQPQTPWQQQTGVSPFIGQPFGAGPGIH